MIKHTLLGLLLIQGVTHTMERDSRVIKHEDAQSITYCKGVFGSPWYEQVVYVKKAGYCQIIARPNAYSSIGSDANFLYFTLKSAYAQQQEADKQDKEKAQSK